MVDLGSSYGRFHKIHHEWKAPIGLAAVYFHPIEHIQVCVLTPALKSTRPSFSRPSTH
jgi:methylsterol monooxygenase